MTGLRRALEGSIGSGSQGSSQEKAGRNRSSKRNREGLERMGRRWGVGVRGQRKNRDCSYQGEEERRRNLD